MSVISANNLEMDFTGEPVFSQVSFDIYENDKVGFIGVNGAGKTSLFKIITKEYEQTDGSVSMGKNVIVGYMEQHACRNSERTVYDEALLVFSSLIEEEIEIEKINRMLDGDEKGNKALISKQYRLQEHFNQNGGLTYKSRTNACLIGLGFNEGDFAKPVSLLSGGQRSKLSLCKLLLSKANLLLLDEPTNHLDIHSVEWLENRLVDFKGTLIVISHDRYFLDRVTNKTMELERGKITIYNGNYSRFAQLKAERRMNEERAYEKSVKEIARIEGIIQTQKHFGQAHNYVTIASKQKSIDRIADTLEKPENELESLKFHFKATEESGNDVLYAENIQKGFSGHTLFQNVSFLIKKNERVFLLGDNGCGKSTMLKVLLGKYKTETGEIKLGSRVRIGYFDQTLSLLNDEKTVLDEVWDSFLDMNESQVRTALGTFLFKNDDVYKKIGSLSGGEKARVALLKLMLSGANMFLLDEPTNHLDIKSREALENALTDYKGTMLIVSHDRYLINKLATRIFRMTENGIKIFDGNYDYYIEHFNEAAQIKQKAEEKPKINDYKLKKQQESEIRRLKGAISRCEKKIEEIEEEINLTQELLNSPEVSSSYTKIAEITEKLDGLHAMQEKLMNEWEEMQEKLEGE